MLNQDQAVEIYRQFLNEVLELEQWYKDVQTHVRATLLYGSVAKGVNGEDSDIDILIIIPLTIEQEFTRGEYYYSYEGNEINIVLRSIEKLKLTASEQKDTFQKEVFRDVRIIDADDEVKELLIKISSIGT
ncbi:hypothetical protein A3D14_01415 [Candidatus Saccharibacteria bacterium RIFCSPHIGHO2_02_FULL_47_12]|nr:MAG: hypothetical protein A3D14_01415 [Candidatus Saccharibacteria bacterium RIFCSPHIGHO2_02_FULL_47_12]